MSGATTAKYAHMRVPQTPLPRLQADALMAELEASDHDGPSGATAVVGLVTLVLAVLAVLFFVT